jgi:[acyl-carrier-protein] S-malonyltransferase
VPGQGTRPTEQAKAASENSPRAQRVFEVGKKITGLDLAEICFGGQSEELAKTEAAQPALSASYLAEFIYLKELGFKPDAGEGHSLGEIPLLAMAEVITVEGMFKLIKSRADATARANVLRPGILGKLSGLSTEQAEAMFGDLIKTGRFHLTNYNSKLQHMVAGDADLINKGKQRLQESAASIKELKGARLSRTRIPAFHSPYHMQPAKRRFLKTAKSIDYSHASFDIMLNNGQYLDELGLSNLPNYLAGQLVGKVLFTQGTERLVKDGVVNFVAVGGDVLSDLVLEDYEDRVNIVQLNRYVQPQSAKET